MQAALLQVGLLVKTRLVSYPFKWDLHCWRWRPSCPCLHICQRWSDIGGRVRELVALPSSTLFLTSIKDADCDPVVGIMRWWAQRAGHDGSKADRFPLSEANRVRETKAKALSEGFADHNSADYPIWCSLRAIGSMAGSCANPNIGIMT